MYLCDSSFSVRSMLFSQVCTAEAARLPRTQNRLLRIQDCIYKSSQCLQMRMQTFETIILFKSFLGTRLLVSLSNRKVKEMHSGNSQISGLFIKALPKPREDSKLVLCLIMRESFKPRRESFRNVLKNNYSKEF